MKFALFRLLFAELRFRKLNFALSVLAVVLAAALAVCLPLLLQAHQRQTQTQLAAMEGRLQAALAAKDQELSKLEDDTRKLMLSMGFNLLILHRDARMDDFWDEGFARHDMPQDYVQRLADARELKHVRHLVATLQHKIKWQGRNVLLVGYLRETPQKYFADKKPMGHDIASGTLYLGYELWSTGGIKQGERVEVLGKSFQVAKTMPEKGSREDITISMNLADAQEILQRPGRINQILAIGCQCEGDRLGTIRNELAQVLPDTKVTEHQTIAQARAEQRDRVAASRASLLARARQQQAQFLSDREAVLSRWRRLAYLATPIVLCVCCLWLALLAWSNVRDRRPEIGVLRAVGRSSLFVAALFLARAVVVGLLGGLAGGLAGLALVRAAGGLGMMAGAESPSLGSLAASAPPWLWPACVLGAPLLSAAASYLPALSAAARDPALALREV